MITCEAETPIGNALSQLILTGRRDFGTTCWASCLRLPNLGRESVIISLDGQRQIQVAVADKKKEAPKLITQCASSL